MRRSEVRLLFPAPISLFVPSSPQRVFATSVPFLPALARHYLTDSGSWALRRLGCNGTMNILILITVVAGLGIAVAVVVRARRNRTMLNKYGDVMSATAIRPPIEVTRNAPQQHERKFYGVSVRPGVNCCDAVKQISRNRYLQGEAPSLPLPNCDRSGRSNDTRCPCKPSRS